MKIKIFVIGLFSYSIVMLLGCAGISKKEADMPKSPGLLEPASMLKLSDLPIPADFKFLPEDSYFFESSGIRVGVLKYRGKADTDRVINFYKEQMPMYNWNLLNIIEFGEHLINFERENETCIINLSSKGKNITITVSLGPKSEIRPKKSDKPVK